MGLTDDDVREILRIVDESDVDELSIQTDGFSLHVLRNGASSSSPTEIPRPAASAAPAAPAAPATPAAPAATALPTEPAPAIEADEDTVLVPSPMLGTFYRAEAPGAAPFVEVGATVGPDSTVCIIEVMKMMNSVAAGVTGTVVEVCAENGELVEYGEPLLRVRVA
jgi:acetyl-CoA carboxylase biotin carboxyl carrier protein